MLYTSLQRTTTTFRDANIREELYIGFFGSDHIEGVRHSILQRIMFTDRGEIHLSTLMIELKVFTLIFLDIIFCLVQCISVSLELPLNEVIAPKEDQEEELLLTQTEICQDFGVSHDGDMVGIISDDITKEDDSRNIEYAKITVSRENKSFMFFCVYCDVSRYERQYQ